MPQRLPPPRNNTPPELKRSPAEWARMGTGCMDAAPIVGLGALIYFVSNGMPLHEALVKIIPLMVMLALIGWAIGFYGAQSRPAVGAALVATLLLTVVLGMWFG